MISKEPQPYCGSFGWGLESVTLSFDISLADLVVRIDSKYDFTERLCKDFICSGEKADLAVFASDEEISAESALYKDPFSRGYCESVCLYRAIAEQLPFLDRFVFHGAAVEAFNKSYIFTAPSGTGKTTHVSLLLKHFGDNVSVINGDKPIIMVRGGETIVYSAPWAGKEGWKSNASARLGGVVLLRRGTVNSIKRIAPEEYFEELVCQAYVPCDGRAMLKTLDMLDELSRSVPFYLLECDMSLEAAKTSFEIMK